MKTLYECSGCSFRDEDFEKIKEHQDSCEINEPVYKKFMRMYIDNSKKDLNAYSAMVYAKSRHGIDSEEDIFEEAKKISTGFYGLCGGLK